jgi:hypothetical protein
VECVSDFGAGMYIFLKFLGGSNILLTKLMAIFSLLQMCGSCV